MTPPPRPTARPAARHPWRSAANLARAAAVVLLGAASAPATAQAALPTPPAPAAGPWVPGQLVEAVHVGRWSPAEVQANAARAFGAQPLPIVENGVDLWRLRVATTALDGGVAVVAAQAFTPVAPSRGAPPLLVYGAGTTGVAAACAPSREYERAEPLGYYRDLLAAFAGRGVAVVLPDYLGFDAPDHPQLYFHAGSEAHVLLDAERAMRELYAGAVGLGPLRPGSFFGGYSQGGHAAFAVADRHAAYAPEVAVTGVLGFAATTDVAALLATAAYYAPYMLLSYRAVYGDAEIDPARVLADRFVATLDTVAARECVDVVQQRYAYDGAVTFTPAFHAALQAGTPETAAPGFARALAANATGLSGHGLPAFLVQGGQDVIVRDPTQARFAAALCAAGSAVDYVHLPAARHRDTRAGAFEPTLAWLWGLALGEDAPSDCASL